MNTRKALAVLAVSLLSVAPVFAKGSHSYSSHSRSTSHSSASRGTYHAPRSPSYHYTRTYTTKRGTTVAGHYSTNPNHHFGDNWSTKGNTNPFTHTAGTKVTPPHGEPQ